MELGNFSYKDYSVVNEQAFLHCILDRFRANKQATLETTYEPPPKKT